MRRTSLILGLCGGAFVLLALIFRGQADEPKNTGQLVAQASRFETGMKLPVARVVLFNSGVGYFQREGDLEGDLRVDLSIPVQDVNDLLKSLVVQDLGGGQVSAVSLDSQAPVEKTLRSFAIDLSSNPSLGHILDQARGEKVEVVLQSSATSQPGTVTGAIVGVEKQKQPAGKDGVVEVEQLNLWCAEGLRQVKLADLQRIRFLNPILESEFRKALEVVTLGHDTQKKAVSFNFNGQGKRSVRIGYVVENPIWKTSYRLVLDKGDKPYLQGWAVVENTTDEDWNGVRMALVSGRPISFKMDLYQPLYVPRPTVEPELFASLRPPTYTGAIDRLSEDRKSLGAELEAESKLKDRALRELSDQDANKFAPTFGKPTFGMNGRMLGRGESQLNLAHGVVSAANAAQLGDYYQYEIDHPVSLARQKSSLLPILNQPVESKRVSIYNERVHARYPLLGIKLRNTASVPLTQGPITVFDGSTYAGDGRIQDLQPREERLLSYAIDLGTEVQAVPHPDNGQLVSVKLVKGVVFTTTRVKESKTYTLVNRSEQDRLVLLEHPNRAEFKITSADKPVETASDVYRFQLNVPRGKTVKQEIAEERTIQQSVSLTNFDDDRIRVFINETASSPKVKEALRVALEKRGRLAQTQQQIAEVQRELNAIKVDQPRLRSNLEKIPGSDPLAKRILEKLNKQETEIERYEEQVKRLNGTADEQRRNYEEFLAKLEVE